MARRLRRRQPSTIRRSPRSARSPSTARWCGRRRGSTRSPSPPPPPSTRPPMPARPGSVVHDGSVDVAYAWKPNLTVDWTSGVTHERFQGTGRVDTTVKAGVGATWKLNRRTWLTGGYRPRTGRTARCRQHLPVGRAQRRTAAAAIAAGGRSHSSSRARISWRRSSARSARFEREGDVGDEEAELGAAIVGAAVEAAAVERLRLGQRHHGVGELDLVAGAALLAGEQVENLRLQDVAAADIEVGGRVLGLPASPPCRSGGRRCRRSRPARRRRRCRISRSPRGRTPRRR